MNHFPMALRILAFLLFAVVSLGAHGAEPSDWKVGLAKVKITPTAPLFMAGYQQRDHPYEKVASDLFAKALSLEDPNGTVAVLVTSDLIWLSAEICDSVAADVAEQAGLKREQLLFNASHTHTGPSLSLGTGKADSGTRNRASGDPQRDMQRNIEYLHAVIDNFSRRILAWKVAATFDPHATAGVLVAAATATEVGQPTVLVDGGVENFNGVVDELFQSGVLKRVLARTEISFSNSLIESWWRVLKHQWLYLNTLDTVGTIERLVAFYVREHNTRLPHSAFGGQTPDEMYFQTGSHVPGELEAARIKARRARAEANRTRTCRACEQIPVAAG